MELLRTEGENFSTIVSLTLITLFLFLKKNYIYFQATKTGALSEGPWMEWGWVGECVLFCTLNPCAQNISAWGRAGEEERRALPKAGWPLFKYTLSQRITPALVFRAVSGVSLPILSGVRP